MNTKAAYLRAVQKAEIKQHIESLEQQIYNNQHDAKLLAELRKDYRAALDKMETFYDDDPDERVVADV